MFHTKNHFSDQIVRRFALVIFFLAIAQLTFAQGAPPPPPSAGPSSTGNLMGVGLEVVKKGKKIILVEANRYSPADESGVLNKVFAGDIQLLGISNSSRDISLKVNKKTTVNEVIDALLGEEASSITLTTRQKGIKNDIYTIINHHFINGKNLSSQQELDYMQTYFQGHMAPMEKVTDTDGDGLTDDQDACPDKEGPVNNRGCPVEDTDSDGDGVPDAVDFCEDVVGSKESHGCPDKDGDGVWDMLDLCVDVFGSKDNYGCPVGGNDNTNDKDTDGDGVKDGGDFCPNSPGTIGNWGCPAGINAFDSIGAKPTTGGGNNQDLFCKNLLKMVADYPSKFASLKGKEYYDEALDETCNEVNSPLPGMQKQYFSEVTFAGLTLYGYTGDYAKMNSLEAAIVKYKELVAIVGACELTPGTWTSEEKYYKGAPIKSWKITSYPNGLTSAYSKFAMSVEVDDDYENGETVYRVFMQVSQTM